MSALIWSRPPSIRSNCSKHAQILPYMWVTFTLYHNLTLTLTWHSPPCSSNITSVLMPASLLCNTTTWIQVYQFNRHIHINSHNRHQGALPPLSSAAYVSCSPVTTRHTQHVDVPYINFTGKMVTCHITSTYFISCIDISCLIHVDSDATVTPQQEA